MTKVIDLNKKRLENEFEDILEDFNKTEKVEEKPYSFEEIAKKNKENEDKLKNERLKNNRSVLKSYRIKH